MTTPTTYNIKNPNDFANALLAELGLPDTKQNVTNIVGWESVEGGNWNNTAKFNPLNTSQPEPGSQNYNGGNQPGVQSYGSWQEGLNATVSTLQAGNNGYPAILSALNTNQSWLNFAGAVQNSSWDANHYGYQLTTDQPNSTAGATNPSAYNQGLTDASQTDAAANSPSSNSKPSHMTGLAGILQQLDTWYNPNVTASIGWNPIADINAIGSSTSNALIMVFVRGTSAILSIGLVVIGIVTLTKGSSSGSSSTSNVLEFVNNAKVQEQRANLTEARIKSRHEYNAGVSERSAERNRASAERQRMADESKRAREAERIAHSKAKEESRNARSNRWADIQEEYATRPGKK